MVECFILYGFWKALLFVNVKEILEMWCQFLSVNYGDAFSSIYFQMF